MRARSSTDDAPETGPAWVPELVEAGPATAAAMQPRRALDFRQDYLDIVRECCEQYGIDMDGLQVEPVSLGTSGGKEVYVVLQTVSRQEAASALQLTYGAPVLEKRIAELVGTRWIGDFTQFAGVWTHWPSSLRVPEDVKSMIRAVRRSRAAAEAP